MSGENQVHASLQAARDGALLVNYMHYFYSLAYPDQPPTQLETCHLSVTTEGYTVILWVHWREVDQQDNEVYIRMEMIEMACMNKVKDLLAWRAILHNYLDYALGERLVSIKKALPLFWQNRPAKKKVRRTKSQTTSTTASGSEVWLELPVMLPENGVRSSADRSASPAKKPKRKLADT